jgi:Na+/melibiose symporter-like transporter
LAVIVSIVTVSPPTTPTSDAPVIVAVVVLNRVPEPARLPGEGKVTIFRSLKLMWKNGLFRRVLLIEILVTGGESFRNTLSLFFMQDVIGIRLAGTYYAIYFAMGLAAIPVWDWIAKRLGKHRSLAAAMVVVSITNVWMFTLGSGQTTAFLLLFMVKGFCFGAFSYLPRAMLADVVDLDTARSGDNRAGSYFAGHGFMTKCAYSLGGVSLPLLALVGYSTAVGAEHTSLQLTWLGFLYAIVPTIAFVFAFWLTWTWPLTSARHAKLRDMLDRKHDRVARREAASPTGVL